MPSSLSSKLTRLKSLQLKQFVHRKNRGPPSPISPSTCQPIHTSSQMAIVPDDMYSPSSPTNVNSFSETLRIVSEEAKNGKYADVFDAFFYTDRRCQNRAFFMAARLKHTLWPLVSEALGTPLRNRTHSVQVPSNKNRDNNNNLPKTSISETTSRNQEDQQIDAFWELVTHRLYTLNCLLFVFPSSSPFHDEAAMHLNQRLSNDNSGARETLFAVRYALLRSHHPNSLSRHRHSVPSGRDHRDDDAVGEFLQSAQAVIARCLESEERLSQSERDAMYLFHGLRMGLYGSFVPHIELREASDGLQEALAEAVLHNQNKSNTGLLNNPFEDNQAIVQEHNNDSSLEQKNSTSILSV
ncbi:hypothetical protein F4703DRAFT_1885377 [Phycomyces blakesleeanus]|uniref:Uncharacterized protein n=2 Tax=Phycomyces blakesleeanus TaxID=4837 RepID=A0A163DE36_PHYB8|nr:hypothetical protein PHYBLDRAFT_69533 [Phycomyces blakesleeanus NRRL 1555(-)]OAD70630.1 hypothetical protein PHYBLDRAFT_69533 [Phycomyces blakesleeanus NRRL 1555(-)]|eukprot:XP_018288670.1 hypothetical protein PHYBLDRAFT_69533 [Phycomyces blakesleeanus NRRL 1555(-)]